MFEIEDFAVSYTMCQYTDTYKWHNVDSLEDVKFGRATGIILGMYESKFDHLNMAMKPKPAIGIYMMDIKSESPEFKVTIRYDGPGFLSIEKKFSNRVTNMEFIMQAVEYINCTFDEEIYRLLCSDRVKKYLPNFVLANREDIPSNQRKVLSELVECIEESSFDIKVDSSLKQMIAKQGFLNPDQLLIVDTEAFLYDKTLKVSL